MTTALLLAGALALVPVEPARLGIGWIDSLRPACGTGQCGPPWSVELWLWPYEIACWQPYSGGPPRCVIAAGASSEPAGLRLDAVLGVAVLSCYGERARQIRIEWDAGSQLPAAQLYCLPVQALPDPLLCAAQHGAGPPQPGWLMRHCR